MRLEDNDGLPWTASTGLGWVVLIAALTSGTAIVALALYLALWIRSKGRSALPLYGFAFSMVCSLTVFTLDRFTPDTTAAVILSLLDLVVWIVATFALRREIQRYYKETEGWKIDIGPFFTLFLSVIYINYCINPAILYGNSVPDTVTSLNLTSPPAGTNLRK